MPLTAEKIGKEIFGSKSPCNFRFYQQQGKPKQWQFGGFGQSIWVEIA